MTKKKKKIINNRRKIEAELEIMVKAAKLKLKGSPKRRLKQAVRKICQKLQVLAN